MNNGCIVCMTMGFLFLLFALLFAFLKERAAVLISGFNSLSKEERSCYDTRRMSCDYRNKFFYWSALWGIGSIFSYIITQYVAIAVFVIWLFSCLKDVRFDDEEAFAKYRF